MTTLNLEASKKVYELLGDTYKTRDSFSEKEEPDCLCGDHVEPGYKLIPKPNFSELIRLLPKIGEKKGWLKATFCMGDVSARTVGEDLTWLYMNAPTEEQGMEEVSKYLLKVL